MLNVFRNFFTPPVFDDDEQTRLARVLIRILQALYILFPTALAIAFINPSTSSSFYTIVSAVISIIATILIWTTKRGYIRASSMALVTMLVVFSFISDMLTNGEPRSIFIVSGAAVVVGGLLLGARGAYITAILFSLKHIVVLILVNSGLYRSPDTIPLPGPLGDGISTTVGYFMIAVIFSLASNSMYSALTRARASEAELSSSNKQLQELTQNLESRILERTSELEIANNVSQKRARQFEAITRVARDIASTRNLDELLPLVCKSVSEQFGYYHAGIFLNDTDNQFSILRAANSLGGQAMLARNHKLKIGEQGIVGYATGSGTPRIALNVGQDAVYFNNPDLPETRSEAAIPLKIASKTVGALDVQSSEANAFSVEDIETLSLLADQVSLAIDNARLYESAIESLEQSQVQYRRYLREEWSRLTQETELVGYRYSPSGSEPLASPVSLGDAGKVALQGQIYQHEGAQASDTAELAIPVRLRGEVIGVLNVSTPGHHAWSDDDIDIAEAVSERLALALENARLFEQTNRRAERERIVSEIASKIGGSIRIESLLETTAQELSQALNGSEVLIQLQSVNQAGGAA